MRTTSTAALTPSAVHEAGHVVVACALGRRVTFIRIGRQSVPADHPHADHLQGAITGGESRFGPALATQIYQRASAGTRLTAIHLNWLRAELVICFAGILAEAELLDAMDQEGAAGDLKQAAAVIGFLGMNADLDGGAARLKYAQDIAQQIIINRLASVEQVAAALSRGPCEFDELAARALLEKSGVKSGSHRQLLSGLARQG